MAVAYRHALRQGPVVRSIARIAFRSATRWMRKGRGGDAPVPGPVLKVTLPPRSPVLVRDYILHVGGSPESYGGAVPAHMFPQWGFPILARTLADRPYDLSRVVNVGCGIRMNRPLPGDEPLLIEACLEDVDDNGRRAIIKQRLVTGTRSAPEAVVSHVTLLVPLKSRPPNAPQKTEERPEKPLVPDEARELEKWQLSRRSGLEFAILTGDFNPMHWCRLYARAFGQRGVILHGFSQVARAIESMNRVLFSDKVGRLKCLEARFTAPLAIPATVGLFVDRDCGVFIGAARGERACLAGTYETREGDES